MKWILLATIAVACTSAPRKDGGKTAIDTTGAIIPSALSDSVGVARPDGRAPSAYFEFQVERAAIPLNPDALRGPEYPTELREARIEGEIVVQYIVDETGRPDLDSFRVLRTSDTRFGPAVRAFIATVRFQPAALHGKPVRQLVQQPFTFSLPR